MNIDPPFGLCDGAVDHHGDNQCGNDYKCANDKGEHLPWRITPCLADIAFYISKDRFINIPR